MRLHHHPRLRRRLAWLAAAIVLTASGCSGEPSLDELTTSADALAVPAGWDLVDEEVADRPCRDPVENCPKVDRTYRVPATEDFAAVSTAMLEGAGFEVWNPPLPGCGASPEQGCSARARRGGVSLRATVVEAAAGAGSYTVTVRASEYVGP